MNLFNDKLNDLIDSFKGNVAALTLHKDNIDKSEEVLCAFKLNGIEFHHFISTYEYHKSASLFVVMEEPVDSDILKALEISCLLLGVDYASIEPCFEIGHPNYGYSIVNDANYNFRLSLKDIQNEYSPLDIERLLSEAKSKVAPQAFIGFDMTAPESDRTEVAA